MAVPQTSQERVEAAAESLGRLKFSFSPSWMNLEHDYARRDAARAMTREIEALGGAAEAAEAMRRSGALHELEGWLRRRLDKKETGEVVDMVMRTVWDVASAVAKAGSDRLHPLVDPARSSDVLPNVALVLQSGLMEDATRAFKRTRSSLDALRAALTFLAEMAKRMSREDIAAYLLAPNSAADVVTPFAASWRTMYRGGDAMWSMLGDVARGDTVKEAWEFIRIMACRAPDQFDKLVRCGAIDAALDLVGSGETVSDPFGRRTSDDMRDKAVVVLCAVVADANVMPDDAKAPILAKMHDVLSREDVVGTLLDHLSSGGSRFSGEEAIVVLRALVSVPGDLVATRQNPGWWIGTATKVLTNAVDEVGYRRLLPQSAFAAARVLDTIVRGRGEDKFVQAFTTEFPERLFRDVQGVSAKAKEAGLHDVWVVTEAVLRFGREWKQRERAARGWETAVDDDVESAD